MNIKTYRKKTLVQNAVTYGIVLACFILVQILTATGGMTSLLKGILVPLCTYVILAVSLNLTVGILGELSLDTRDLCAWVPFPEPSSQTP